MAQGVYPSGGQPTVDAQTARPEQAAEMERSPEQTQEAPEAEEAVAQRQQTAEAEASAGQRQAQLSSLGLGANVSQRA